jgi:hypothetical protein
MRAPPPTARAHRVTRRTTSRPPLDALIVTKPRHARRALGLRGPCTRGRAPAATRPMRRGGSLSVAAVTPSSRIARIPGAIATAPPATKSTRPSRAHRPAGGGLARPVTKARRAPAVARRAPMRRAGIATSPSGSVRRPARAVTTPSHRRFSTKFGSTRTAPIATPITRWLLRAAPSVSAVTKTKPRVISQTPAPARAVIRSRADVRPAQRRPSSPEWQRAHLAMSSA